MELNGKRLILASNSPRRQELLKGLDVDFVIDTQNNFEERFSEDTPLCEVPALMSRGKSHGFHRPLEKDEILITSDTMVLLGGKILGKPSSREDAVRMLKTLSGQTHEVITAVTIRDGLGFEETFTDSTLVTFAALDDEEIDYYLTKYRPFDKAGAYGVQEWIGYVAITRLEGSFYNVMGFPVHKVYGHLLEFVKH